MEKSLLLSKTALLVAALWSAATWAQTGGEAGAYLRAPVDAQAAAMGGAQSASPSYFASWWNPAQLCLIDKRVLSAGTGLYSQGQTEAFADLEFKLPPRVGIGLGALYRGDPFLNDLYNASEEKLDNGAYTTLTVKAAFSYLFTRRLSAGLSIGFFYQQIPTSYVGTSLQYSDATAVGGFSFAAQYKLTDSLTIALAIRDVSPLQILSGAPAGIAMNWQVSQSLEQNSGGASGLGSPTSLTDMIMPAFVLASSWRGILAGYPLVWDIDIDGYAVDGTFTKLNSMEAVLFTGAEWRRWQTFRLRAGIGDITMNRYMTSDTHYYWQNFAFCISAGFGLDLNFLHRGLVLNYALTTDKVWAGVNQKLDVVYGF